MYLFVLRRVSDWIHRKQASALRRGVSVLHHQHRWEKRATGVSGCRDTGWIEDQCHFRDLVETSAAQLYDLGIPPSVERKKPVRACAGLTFLAPTVTETGILLDSLMSGARTCLATGCRSVLQSRPTIESRKAWWPDYASSHPVRVVLPAVVRDRP